MNAGYIWIGLACHEIGYTNYKITGQHFLKGNFFGFRDLAIVTLFGEST